MRRTLPILCVALAGLAPAQEPRQATTYVYGLNGGAHVWTETASGAGRSRETVRNLNGREVPIEQVQEKVLKNEGGVRIVETLVKTYDANGQPLAPVKVVTEETKQPDGSVITRSTTYKGDISGKLQPAERSTTEIRKSGDSETGVTTIERPTLNGGFAMAEKREITSTKTDTSSETQVVTLLPSVNGTFNAALKVVTKEAKQGDVVVTQKDRYESANTGSLALANQSISKTVKNADGSERTETNVYGMNAPGNVVPDSRKMQFRERQIVEKTPTKDGSVETFSVQQADHSKPNGITPVIKISETVCKGKC